MSAIRQVTMPMAFRKGDAVLSGELLRGLQQARWHIIGGEPVEHPPLCQLANRNASRMRSAPAIVASPSALAVVAATSVVGNSLPISGCRRQSTLRTVRAVRLSAVRPALRHVLGAREKADAVLAILVQVAES